MRSLMISPALRAPARGAADFDQDSYIEDGVALAPPAVADGQTPVVLADHSDRSAPRLGFLKEIIAQDLSNTLIATSPMSATTAKLKSQAPRRHAFDMEVGRRGRLIRGPPMRIQGRSQSGRGPWPGLGLRPDSARDNLLILSTFPRAGHGAAGLHRWCPS